MCLKNHWQQSMVACSESESCPCQCTKRRGWTSHKESAEEKKAPKPAEYARKIGLGFGDFERQKNSFAIVLSQEIGKFLADLEQASFGRFSARRSARLVAFETELVSMKTPDCQFSWNVHGGYVAGQAKQPIKVRDRTDVGLEPSRRPRDGSSHHELI